MEYFSPGVVSFDTLEVHSICNTADDVILRNIEVNSGRDLPWVDRMGPEKSHSLVVVCGGPSLEGTLVAIKNHARRGDYILAVNHTAQWLIERRVAPDGIILLDADPLTAECIVPGLTHFIASQCDPCVFDAAENVILWHSKTDGSEEAAARGNKYHDGPYASIGGGVTVGQRAVTLGFVLGFRSFDIYGMDSSFDGSGHAYEHDWTNAKPMMRVESYGRSFVIEPWMGAQAKFWPYLKNLIQSHGGTIRAHGDGLIPWIDKHI